MVGTQGLRCCWSLPAGAPLVRGRTERGTELHPCRAAMLASCGMWLVAGALLVVCLGIWRAPTRFRLSLWTVVIIACVVPWFSMTPHPHWPRIGWVPFDSPPVRIRDILLNAALYVPFGLFSRRPVGRSIAAHVFRLSAYACALSVSTEVTQVYSHGRFPSMTDVVMNTIGAGLGAIGAGGRKQPSH